MSLKNYINMSDDELVEDLTKIEGTPEQEAHNVKKSTKKKSTKNNVDIAKIQSLIKPFDTSIPVKPTEFIGGLFARGYVTVIVAPAGTGKSIAMQKMFTDLSHGGQFFGGFAENEPERKSVILCGELGEQGLRERAKQFNLQSNPENVVVLDQTACEAQGVSFMLESKKGRQNLEIVIEQTKPDILFIDSFTAFFGGKENDNSECNEVFGYLRRIASKYQIALVVTHHSRKRLSSEQSKPLTLDDVVGANAITRHVYSVIAIEYDKKIKLNRITCLKCWGKKFRTFGFSINYSLYGQAYIQIDLDPSEINDEKLHASTSNVNQNPEWQIIIRGYLLGKGKEGASLSEILQAIGEDGIERDTFKHRLDRLAQRGEVIKPRRGYYALPEDKLIKPGSEQLEIFECDDKTECDSERDIT